MVVTAIGQLIQFICYGARSRHYEVQTQLDSSRADLGYGVDAKQVSRCDSLSNEVGKMLNRNGHIVGLEVQGEIGTRQSLISDI